MELETNKARVSGIMVKDFEFSHEVKGEKFYKTIVASERLSGVKDFVPVTASERLLQNKYKTGDKVYVGGSFRSYNRCDGEVNKKEMFLFAAIIDYFNGDDVNNVEFIGYICKPVGYRETPFGKHIADVLLAVNRKYKNSDYISCIAWGNNARYAQTLPVGTELSAQGRIQSREYKKRYPDGSEEIKTAIEVSIHGIQIVCEEDTQNG